MKKLYALFLVLAASVAFATHEINPFTGSGGGGVTSVSGTTPVSVASGSTTPVVSMSVADSTTDGYLTSSNWVLFNSKVPATRNVSTTAPLTGGGNLSADRTLSIPVATSAANGYLASGDWSIFNGKVTSVSGTAPVVSSGGTTPAISIPAATTSANGYLTSTDWGTFNGKQAAGSYITALTGDVTASGPGSAAATLATVTTGKGGTNATTWTAGSIPYLSSTTQFAEDNTKLFWDGTNHRLGIGTNVPGFPLEVKSAFTQTAAIQGAVFLDPVVTAHAVNDTPTGMYANPTFSNGGFGGVEPSAIRAKGNSALALALDSDGNNGVIQKNYSGSNVQWQVQTNGRMYISGGGTGTATDPDYGYLTDLHSGFYLPTPSQLAFSTASTQRVLIKNTTFELTTEEHLKSTGTAATATVNANAGTGASCTVSNATDVAGTVNLTTTAIAGSSGVVCDVNFNVTYGVAPICVTTPVSANAIVDAVIQGAYFTTSTTKLSINFANTDAVGRTYNWSYHCIETQ